MRRVFSGILVLTLAGCALPTPQPTPPAETLAVPGMPAANLLPVSALPGWNAGNAAGALAAFVSSCKLLLTMPADQALGGSGEIAAAAGQAGDWQPACTAAEAVAPGDEPAAQQFFTANFAAIEVSDSARVTGYFEPEYDGAKNPAPGFTVPIYAKPDDHRLAVLPRAAIDDHALYRKAPVTAYLGNPVDAYMLQIYGAGRILLRNGTTLSVDFDGENGLPYTPIGRILVADGDLPADAISPESISSWLKTHPAEAKSIMEQNANYVYLKPLGDLPQGEYAPGTLGVPKIAFRTLAVDSSAIPLGAPVFLATTDPETGAAMDRLTVAQDTDAGLHGDSAVKLFFGAGAQAESMVGMMHQPAHLYLLLPRSPAAS